MCGLQGDSLGQPARVVVTTPPKVNVGVGIAAVLSDIAAAGKADTIAGTAAPVDSHGTGGASWRRGCAAAACEVEACIDNGSHSASCRAGREGQVVYVGLASCPERRDASTVSAGRPRPSDRRQRQSQRDARFPKGV